MSNLPNNLTVENVHKFQADINSKILKKLNKSIVFADNQFLEWFNLTLGIDNLIKQAGALNIKDFSSFENGGEHLKAVFFISQPLRGLVIETLKDILVSSNFQFITIITNLHPNFYGVSQDLFDQLRDDCLIWMSNANYTCDILYEKFPFAILTQNSMTSLYLNPLSSWLLNTENPNQLVSIDIYHRLVKQELSELHSLNSGHSANKDHYQNLYQFLNETEIKEVKGLVYSINEMLEYLEAKDDCFTLGVLSSIVANELNHLDDSKLRRKNSPNKVSLLLVDRNLDLAMNALFHEETVFDKVNNLLPNLNNQSNDVQIDLRNSWFENNFKSILPGNYFHTSSQKCNILIDQFFCLKPKECLLDVYRKLCEVFPLNESNKDKKAIRINSDSLKSQIRNGIKSNKKAFMENLDLLQIITAYCQINDAKSTKQQEFDKLMSFVKVLTQNILNKDGPSVLTRLYTLFSENSDKSQKAISYTISDLILLLIYVYSLIGEECYYGIEEEERIKKLLVQEFESENLEHDHRLKADLDFFNKIKGNQNYSQFVDTFLQNLKQLKMYRKQYKQYNKLLVKEDSNDQYSYKPLIKQVCENIVQTVTTPEQFLDIEYKTSGTEGLGLNLFKSFKMGFMASSNKPHPLNNDFIIIYFIGGITSYDHKIVKEVFSKAEMNGKTVLIGSSHFNNHNKLIKYIMS